MKIRRYLPLLLAAGVVAIAALLLARRNLNEPHLRLFSEMVDSPAYRSQTTNPNFLDGRTLRSPVPGTISRDFTPLHYDATKNDRTRAGKELKNPLILTYDVLSRGKKVYENFCSHCHGTKGRGDGKVTKLFPGFSFPIATKSAFDMPDGEIFHILSYGRNLMPSHASQITQEDRWKLVHYLRDLQRIEIDRLGPLAEIPVDPRRNHLVSKAYGKEIFDTNCATCHGKEGRHPKRGIPTLNAPAVLAYADDAFYWNIINHGKKGTQMPAWNKILTTTQSRSLIAYIRSWATQVPDRAQILSKQGNPRIGRSLYRGHCAGCHGVKGQGGIGNSLNAPSFQALASDEFLRDTIALGRDHTAMPAAYDFSPQDIADLISFIRTWNPKQHTYADVAPLINPESARIGKKIYRAKCSGCHGKNGEGGIGSVINSQSFLSMVDNKFLYRAITEGRPDTAMPAWSFLPKQDLADVIGYIRTWQKEPSRTLSSEQIAGRMEFGRLLFNRHCTKCHGKGARGDLGAQISNPTFLSHVSDQFLWHSIAYGKKGSEMKGFLKRKRDPLNQDDINHLIAYLRHLQKNPPLDPPHRDYTWADADAGKEIYEKIGGCSKCHGEQGQGASGPAIGSQAFLRVASDGFIAGTMVLGRENSEMLSFYRGGNVSLKQEDLENVIAYIRQLGTIKKKKPRRISSSPSIVADGKVLYRQFCAGCHGSQGRGSRDQNVKGYAPSLNSKQFLEAADDSFLLATMALGRPGTPMRAFAETSSGIGGLSPEDMRKIVAFIRSWEKSAR